MHQYQLNYFAHSTMIAFELVLTLSQDQPTYSFFDFLILTFVFNLGKFEIIILVKIVTYIKSMV